MSTEGVAEVLRRAYARTLASVDLCARVRETLAETSLTPSVRGGGIVVVALGKSAAPMLAGAVAAWGDAISRVVVARPARSVAVDRVMGATGAPAGTMEFAGGHPLPDPVSVAAGHAVRDAVGGLSARDTVLVLLSGGASAAACLPREGVTLWALREATRALFAEGAPIERVNALRGAMDGLKHGGLRRLAGDARVLTLASVDVLGDDATALRTLGSAPTVACDDDLADVRVVARPGEVREAMGQALESAGWKITRDGDVRGSVDDLAVVYGHKARTLGAREGWVAVGEPTVALPTKHGRGGRAGRLALGVARALAGGGDVGFLAAGTDGVDGGSEAAGAVVTSATWGRDPAAGEAALRDWDDAGYHRAMGTAVAPGPTGINLLDVHAMLGPG